MAKPAAKTKKPGRPGMEGGSVFTGLRLPVPLSAAVDDWAAAQGVRRSEAIRRLVELGLKKGQGKR